MAIGNQWDPGDPPEIDGLVPKSPKVFYARDLSVMLERKYCSPSWAFFTEVKSAVGFGRRRADGIAIALWRSLGLEIHGFEIKCSRADWLNELKDGGKSDEIFKYCHRWWVVAANSSIVQEGELPPTWGLQIASGRGLKIAAKAPRLTPEPLTVQFVAEILRRADQSQKRPEALELEFQRGKECGRVEATSYDLKYQVEQAEKLKIRVDAFEKASGVKIDHWHDADKIGEAVKYILEHGGDKTMEELQYARSCVDRLLKDFDKALESLKIKA
jgi:hypothetical protein